MGLTLAAVGDCIIARSLPEPPGPDLLALREVLSAADCAFANLELLPHRMEGPPSVESGGTWLCCEPERLRDLRWLGLGLFGCAHNHVHDWGRAGLLAGIRHLDAARIAYAGIGADLAAARAPRYVETAAGRVGLVAAASTFSTESRAGAGHGDVPGRPGLNPLRYRRSYAVSEADMAHLGRIADLVQATAARRERVRDGWVAPDPDGVRSLFGQRFVRCRPGEEGERTEPEPADVEGNLRAVREAARQADWVVVSLHAHESLPGRREEAAQFIRPFAHACIDAGAHAVIGHGPHVLRGIEFHRGRPILYSLGNFIFENELMPRQPADMYERYGLPPEAGPADAFDARGGNGTRGFASDRLYWESVVATLHLDAGGASGVEVRPVCLGFGLPRAQRGRPYPARADEGEAIAARLDRLSRPLGVGLQGGEGGVWRAVPTGAGASGRGVAGA